MRCVVAPTIMRDREAAAALKSQPAELVDLPKFPNEKIDPARSGGDIVVQACANDPQVAVHAIRNLARAGSGVVEYKWSQLGFGHATATTRGRVLPAFPAPDSYLPQAST